jgi:hypothetical protein
LHRIHSYIKATSGSYSVRGKYNWQRRVPHIHHHHWEGQSEGRRKETHCTLPELVHGCNLRNPTVILHPLWLLNRAEQRTSKNKKIVVST